MLYYSEQIADYRQPLSPGMESQNVNTKSEQQKADMHFDERISLHQEEATPLLTTEGIGVTTTSPGQRDLTTLKTSNLNITAIHHAKQDLNLGAIV